MLAAAGRFDVMLDDGHDQQRVTLSQPSVGLYIPPMTWRELDNFSSGSVCMVLASEYYDEADYLHQVYTLAKPDYSGRVTVPVL